MLEVAPESLVTAYQVHGTAVADVTAPWAAGEGPKADALVTTERGIALGILTADCTPILLADAKADDKKEEKKDDKKEIVIAKDTGKKDDVAKKTYCN